MILDFPIFKDKIDCLKNYDLFMLPNGVYRAKKIVADNYLYPMYFIKENDEYVVSTSVYALIHYKKHFIRNPRFQITQFFQPSFLTIDREVVRARTVYRRSSLKLTEKDEIVKLGAELIQDYITEIEKKYPGWVHILLMGGKDSENIILTKRKERWMVLSGGRQALFNGRFISDNSIDVEKFIKVKEEFDDKFLTEEIMASDCMFDAKHFRWVGIIHDLVKEFNGKAVLWMGTSGDGIFKRNNNHRDKDYYAVHDLHVGMAMGILHQMYKNILNIPVVSPYQSPRFINELFYQFDPYFVDRTGDVRPELGRILFGKPVKYPNPPKEDERLRWKSPTRKRSLAIPLYLTQLNKEGILCQTKRIRSWAVGTTEKICDFFDRHSNKRRTLLSRILFPLRKEISKIFPIFRNKRHDIAAREIK